MNKLKRNDNVRFIISFFMDIKFRRSSLVYSLLFLIRQKRETNKNSCKLYLNRNIF